MDYNEFSQKIKAKYPQYENIDNKELAQKMIAKYPEYKNQVTFGIGTPQTQQQPKGIDLTPSGLFKGSQDVVASAIAAPITANKNNISLKEAYDKNRDVLKQHRTKNPTPIQDFVVDMAGYSLIPTPNAKAAGLARTGQFLGQAALQGGLPAALETMRQGGNLGDIAKSAVIGTGIGAGVQKFAPPLIEGVGKIGKMVKGASQNIPEILGAIAQLEPQTVAQAIKPGSKALEYTKKGVQSKKGDIIRGIREGYNEILTEKGNRVGRLLEQLPEDVKFKAGDILGDYDKIYNNYSLSKNELLNPARNATKKELSQIEDLVYGDSSNNLQNFKNAMDELKYPNGKLDVQKRRHRGNYYSKSVNSLGNDITIANRRFNDEILGNLKQNPDWANDPKKIEALEKQISAYSVPEEYQQEMYNKLYEAISKGEFLNKSYNPVTPKELYDINKNISERMIDWNKVGGENDIRNSVLDQMYGMNAEKISNLSPELKDANKAFSDLMDFKKSEGIRAILNPNNTDNAISKLKNYDTMASVEKGQNIRNLEKLMVDEGYSPFLSDIDDIVAAEDLLKKDGTGLGGLTALAKKIITRPSLKAIRNYNSSNMSARLQSIGEKIQNLSPLAQKLLTPLVVEATAPMLYGGIQQNEVR